MEQYTQNTAEPQDKKANHQANVIRIEEILPHTNADNLEIIPIGGFQVVTRKGQFKVGDLGVYIQPDSIVPKSETFKFLWEGHEDINGVVPTKYLRITVRKFRKEWSEGLLLPVFDFPQLLDSVLTNHFVESDYPVGTDVSDLLGITHYDPDTGRGSTGDNEKVIKGAPKLKRKYPTTLKGWFFFLLHKLRLRRDEKNFSETVSFHVPTYDVEGFKNYPNVFKDGEHVFVTEKIHGCVIGSTKVRMANGTRKFIRDIEIGDVVIGVNKAGSVSSSKVVKTYNNGKTEQWLRVSGKREGLAGRGNSFFAVYCTPEHKFWVVEKQEFVEAKSLSIGEHVLTLRTDLSLTPVQYQVVLGKLLGDGHLATAVSTSALHFGHREKDKDYLNWTLKGLGNLANHRTDNYVSGYGTNMFRGSSIGTGYLKQEFECFYEGDKKQVPFWVESELTPLSLAFWYMDDGSLCHSDGQEDRASFATCGFDYKSCTILIKALARLGVEAEVSQHDYNRIVLNTENAERLFLLIAPYIPKCMQRKLPERYRGGEGWLPNTESVYKPELVSVSITSIESAPTITSKKYDLETETHNYFANNILVHNSNARYLYLDGAQYAGSRNLWKAADSNCAWRRALVDNPWIGEFCRNNPGYVLWGEITPTQGGFDYITSPNQKGKIQFFAFDVRTPKGEWEPKNIAWHLIDNYGGRFVPVLYDGPYDYDVIKGIVDGKSATGANHVREGIVITALDDRTVRGLGRPQLKIVSNSFLEKDSK